MVKKSKKKKKIKKKGVEETKPESKELLKEVKQVAVKEKKSGRKEVDIDKWIEENVREFVELSGLSMLGLSEAQYVELLHEILTQLYGSPTTRTDVETVVKRYNRHKETINELIANKLIYVFETLPPHLLDFVVASIRDSVLFVAPKIYEQIVKEKRTDLTEILRIKWFDGWVRKKYRIPPITCPRCGFNSVMPDLSCLVCGFSVSESQLKKHVDFERNLERFVKELSCGELKELLNYESVFINSQEIKKPTEIRSPVDIELYLTPKEKKIIRETYISKCRTISNEGSK